MKNTSPGTTLREFGLTSISPTVPTASGAWLRAIASIALDHARGAEQRILAQRASASRRYAPPGRSRVTSYQRMPCTPVTTPMSLAFGLEDRPLLDMQLEERRERMLAAALGPR